MIHADNILAQLAADTGMISLLVLGCLLLWMVRRMWRLSERVADPVVVASLMGALYTLLVGQIESGWSQSTLIQVLLGLQVAALCLPVESPDETLG
jgi:O-antigen ligase